ncbi:MULTISPECIES: hypothetical protein [Bacillaceae]|uniref:hypothetical protein n=1 Tax=Bacillaceae TaxID=186817 RepID=UPI00118A284C|nr:hypothetical protein [Bacillus sp. S3]QCJ43912.1 hypothetical protein FAY30_19510 [Bacillus sp. S3]
MEKVKLALNYALMLEMMKAKGHNQESIVALLDEGKDETLEKIGEGIPDWKTLVDFYQSEKSKVVQALQEGYEISFLTKGALKSLLSIKFNMKEGVDFVDTGVFLDCVKMTTEHLQILRDVMAKNWSIVMVEEEHEQEIHVVKIELTHQPKFNIH